MDSPDGFKTSRDTAGAALLSSDSTFSVLPYLNAQCETLRFALPDGFHGFGGRGSTTRPCIFYRLPSIVLIKKNYNDFWFMTR